MPNHAYTKVVMEFKHAAAPYPPLIDFDNENDSTSPISSQAGGISSSSGDPFAVFNISPISPPVSSSDLFPLEQRETPLYPRKTYPNWGFDGAESNSKPNAINLSSSDAQLSSSCGSPYNDFDKFPNVIPFTSPMALPSPSDSSSSSQMDLLSSNAMSPETCFPTMGLAKDLGSMSAQGSCHGNDASTPFSQFPNAWSFEDMSSLSVETPPSTHKAPSMGSGSSQLPYQTNNTSPQDMNSASKMESRSAVYAADNSLEPLYTMPRDLGFDLFEDTWSTSSLAAGYSQYPSPQLFFQPAKDGSDGQMQPPGCQHDANDDSAALDAHRVFNTASAKKVTVSQDSQASRNDSVENVPDKESNTCLSKYTGSNASELYELAEFVGSGGGKGVYKAPERGADRPVPLELRPQPLNDAQPSRVLTCTDSAVWSGGDVGIMVWDLQSACRANCDGKGNLEGDRDASTYCLLPLNGLAPTCLCADIGNNIMWSGHKDGRVRAWDIKPRNDAELRPLLFWQAHQTPVLAMVVTSYGDVWTGSDNGALRAWPCAVVSHALSKSNHALASTVEASYIDLRTRGAAAGAPNLSTADVQFLISEHSTCRVWSGGLYLLALWDERSRDILKVFGPNPEAEFTSPNISPVRESTRHEETKVNLTTKVLKKEKSQGPLSFFQRSRNMVMGAADAVLRATVGIQSLDESKKIEAIVAAADGSVWGGFATGRLVQWDNCGNRVTEVHHSLAAVRCLCAFGNQVFVGYSDGLVQSIATESGKLLASWRANKCAVAKMGVCESHLFTLGDNGAIRGWYITSSSSFDAALHARMISRESSYVRLENLKILAGTWNVGQEKASFKSLIAWLGNQSRQMDIVMVGLQEVEMGAGILAMAAAKETVGLAGSVNGQWWLDSIGTVLNGKTFACIASRQLAGILVGTWVRKELLPHVGGVDIAAVACGFGRAFGNKGAAAVRMMVFRWTVCLVNCHFAAHMDAVVKRNADFEHIYQRMAFGRSYGGVGVAATNMAASAVQILRGRQDGLPLEFQDCLGDQTSSPSFMENSSEDGAPMPDLSDADLLIWVGDFNYRLDDLSYTSAIKLISEKRWNDLVEKDQLRCEMKAGRVFQGMREARISFPPTYKFDKGVTEADACFLGYDSSEKRRVPAWCDRVLFRDSFDNSDVVRKTSLSHPVAAAVTWYGACLEAVESDHKPVSCVFDVEIAVINDAARRWEYGRFIHTHPHALSAQYQLDSVPEIDINLSLLTLMDWEVSVLLLSNKSTCNEGLFYLYCEEESASSVVKEKHKPEIKNSLCQGGVRFPSWLQIMPASGVLRPRQTLKVSVQYAGNETPMEDGISWGTDTLHGDAKKKKTVALVIQVRGALSSCSRFYRVSVSHHLS